MPPPPPPPPPAHEDDWARERGNDDCGGDGSEATKADDAGFELSIFVPLLPLLPMLEVDGRPDGAEDPSTVSDTVSDSRLLLLLEEPPLVADLALKLATVGQGLDR